MSSSQEGGLISASGLDPRGESGGDSVSCPCLYLEPDRSRLPGVDLRLVKNTVILMVCNQHNLNNVKKIIRLKKSVYYLWSIEIGGESNPDIDLISPVKESCVLFLLLSLDLGRTAACRRSFPSELLKKGGILPVSICGIPEELKLIPLFVVEPPAFPD